MDKSVEAFVQQFPDVLLECPIPGQSIEQMTVAEFAESTIGQKYLGGLATGYAQLSETGMTEEQKLVIVGGAALVRDETENIVGLAHTESQEFEPLESKKK